MSENCKLYSPQINIAGGNDYVLPTFYNKNVLIYNLTDGNINLYSANTTSYYNHSTVVINGVDATKTFTWYPNDSIFTKNENAQSSTVKPFIYHNINENNSLELLWETIFDICLVNTDNPEEEWTKKMAENHQMCKKLTDLNIKELHYESSNGTNLTVELPKNAIWCGGSSLIKGREPIVNMPTEEVFTMPHKFKVDGIVASTKPLVYGGGVINDFYVEFKNGKVINYDAKEGKELLKGKLLTAENGMNILGAHIDSPRLDVKQNPLYEDGGVAYLDTHYYGEVSANEKVFDGPISGETNYSYEEKIIDEIAYVTAWQLSPTAKKKIDINEISLVKVFFEKLVKELRALPIVTVVPT